MGSRVDRTTESKCATRPPPASSPACPTPRPTTSTRSCAWRRPPSPPARGRRCSPSDRERCLLRLADLVETHADELQHLIVLENGKLLQAARREVDGSVRFIRYAAGWATKIVGETLDVSFEQTGARFQAYTRREPVGVVGGILPWNMPLSMAVWKAAPALACGCAVVLKPAEETPLSALRLAELAAEAGLPARLAERRDRRRAGRCGTSRAPARGEGVVHRLDRGGAPGGPDGGRAAGPVFARARRQVAGRGVRRRRRRPRRPRTWRGESSTTRGRSAPPGPDSTCTVAASTR